MDLLLSQASHLILSNLYHFSYSIVIEHQIKLCLVVFGLKGAILVGFWSQFVQCK